jgi:RNA chaperone Hfq
MTRPIYNREVPPQSEETESSYLKSLIESRSIVTVILKNGEKLKGRIRYYDRDCFSVGLTTEKRKVFLRKENVSYIAEEK